MAGELLLVVLAVVVAGVSSQAQCPDQMDADVLILGAGMAGLGAAETLSEAGINDYLILEMRDRIGGRVQTASFGGGNVELGPQWVLTADSAVPEEIQNPLLPLVRRCNVTLRDIPFGNLGRVRVSYNSRGEDITEEVSDATNRYLTALFNPATVQAIFDSISDSDDLPFTQALRVGGWNPRTQLEEHAEFNIFDVFAGISTDLASYRDIAEPETAQERAFLFGPNPVNYVVTDPDGYEAIPQCLARQFLTENDPRLILRTTIVDVMWSDECVCAMTRDTAATGDGRRYCAPYAIVTFSVGALQNANTIRYSPEIPFTKRLTLNQFEMGNFLKVYIAFNETFWDTDLEFITYFDERRESGYYPTFIPWGSFFPEKPHILEVLLATNEAKRVAFQDIEITMKEIAEVMRNIYGERASDPVDIIMHDFIVNPYFLGDFSVVGTGVGRQEFEEMNTPCGNLYFAGEAFIYRAHSTVHGGLLHGRETAARIVDLLVGPIQVSFMNDSPRVEGGSVSAEFRTSKPFTSLECVINSTIPRQNCSSGRVTFAGLDAGRYELRVIARVGGEGAEVERGLARSVVTVITSGEAQCAAHLINSGISVNGRRASVEFSSSGRSVSGFRCTLDGVPLESCTSPVVLRRLSPGRHRLRILPVCPGVSTRTVALIDIA